MLFRSCPVAANLHIGFVPVRKPGKLPRETISYRYDLEYGSNELHMHKDAIKPGQKVLIVDDLLATGGTVQATIKMIEELGGVVVGCAFLIELERLERARGAGGLRSLYVDVLRISRRGFSSVFLKKGGMGCG